MDRSIRSFLERVNRIRDEEVAHDRQKDQNQNGH